jgi:endonuclease III
MSKRLESLCAAIMEKQYTDEQLDQKAKALLDKLFTLRTIEAETKASIKETQLKLQAILLAKKTNNGRERE